MELTQWMPTQDGDGTPDGTEVENGTDPLSTSIASKTTSDDGLCVDPFIDMEGHWAEVAVCTLYEQGIVKGKKLKYMIQTAMLLEQNS